MTTRLQQRVAVSLWDICIFGEKVYLTKYRNECEVFSGNLMAILRGMAEHNHVFAGVEFFSSWLSDNILDMAMAVRLPLELHHIVFARDEGSAQVFIEFMSGISEPVFDVRNN